MFGTWVGGTTCIGSRLARLDIKLLSALLLVDFDFDTVDAFGRVVDSLPKSNWNGPVTCRPVQGRFFLKYRNWIPSSLWASPLQSGSIPHARYFVPPFCLDSTYNITPALLKVL
jgi:hypothetical protein